MRFDYNNNNNRQHNGARTVTPRPQVPVPLLRSRAGISAGSHARSTEFASPPTRPDDARLQRIVATSRHLHSHTHSLTVLTWCAHPSPHTPSPRFIDTRIS